MSIKKIVLFILIAIIALGNGCRKDEGLLPCQIAESPFFLSSKDELLQEINWDLDQNFTLTDSSESTQTYAMNQQLVLIGKDADVSVTITDGNINSINFTVVFESSKDHHKFMLELFDILRERYGKPDTSYYIGESIVNHIDVPAEELYSASFGLRDEWVMPPVMDDPSVLLTLHSIYQPELQGTSRYVVRISTARYSLRVLFQKR